MRQDNRSSCAVATRLFLADNLLVIIIDRRLPERRNLIVKGVVDPDHGRQSQRGCDVSDTAFRAQGYHVTERSGNGNMVRCRRICSIV